MSGSGKLGFWTKAAMIAAVYALLAIVLAPISYGMIQVRVGGVDDITLFYTGSHTGSLCRLHAGQPYGGNGILDIVCGSLATLLAAYLTSRIKNRCWFPCRRS